MALRASSIAVAAALLVSPFDAAQAQSDVTLPTIRVAPATPSTATRSAPSAPGRPAAPPGEVEIGRIPEMVDTVTANDVSRTYSASVTEALQQRVPGVSLQDVQGRPANRPAHADAGTTAVGVCGYAAADLVAGAAVRLP
jgi:hypothetical protein